MRFVIQRVTNAKVDINGRTVGSINKGFTVLIGISNKDNEDIADKMVKKLIGLRIFEDAEGRMNISPGDAGAEIMIVSQFTLYADCRHGNRPSFVNAGAPDMAKELYEYIIEKCKAEVPVVEQGEFGGDMQVSLVNDGPFTILLDSNDLK